MRQLRIRTLAAIGLLGLGTLGLAGCQPGQEADAGRAEQAAQQFVAERGGPRAIARPENLAVGEIKAVDGATITLASPIDGATSIIELADGAPISRTAELRPEEIAVGEQVLAFGALDGDELAAAVIEVGPAGGSLGAGPMVFSDPGLAEAPLTGVQPDAVMPGADSSGAPQVAGGGAGRGDMLRAAASGDAVSGSVVRVEDGALVVKGDDGKETTVRLAPGATINKEVAADRGALQPGEFVMAEGRPGDGVFRAASLRIMPKPAMAPAR